MALVLKRRRVVAPAALSGPILVVTGMKREAACVTGDGVVALCSGANVQRLHAELHALRDQPFSAVVSFGLAGALDYSLRPGDVLVADTVVHSHARHTTHDRLSDALAEGAAAKGCRIRPGAIVGVNEPAMDRHAKTRLRETAKASAVDMESHLAIDFARDRAIPFAVLRAISDPAARALPSLAAGALTPDGRVDGKKVARELVRAPRQMGELILAGLDSRAAFVSLGRCGPLLGPLLRLVLAGL